jgi:hypothetical protein
MAGGHKMKWLEIIELRSADGNREQLELMLNNLINETALKGENQVTVVYKHVMIDNDFSIHLTHDTMKVERSGSQLGLSIASSLKEYGMVNHSIWVERSI